jgi:hypothetical protein
MGTSRIDHPAIDSVQVNQYGSVTVQGNSGEHTYAVQFDPTQSLDSPPTQIEMDIPAVEKPTIQKILNSLNLTGQSKQEIIRLVTTFFKKNFEYSLVLPQPQQNSTPLSTFLLDQRSGHCEYFASATSLLLRLAGIPTRYAVGYSVHEYSPSEQAYVVRARNAHAWVMAYVDGAWMTVDTTPGGGTSQAGTSQSRNSQISSKTHTEKLSQNKLPQSNNINPTMEKIKYQKENEKKAVGQVKDLRDIPDFINKISNQFSLQFSNLTKRLDSITLASIIIVLGIVIIFASVFFAYWISRRRFSRRSKRLKHPVSRWAVQSKDDGVALAFHHIEQRLREWGVERQPSETVRQWILRLKQKLPESKMNRLNEIIDLHYRYRFDPQGIAQEDCTKLKGMIQSWLLETAA